MRSILIVCSLLSILTLVACGGGGGGGGGNPVPVTPRPTPTPDPTPRPVTSNPEYHLQTRRFTIQQPKVLEQVGTHHAYARGLTGRGVRIGIDDSIVDYTQTAEFGSRIKLRAADGASLLYSRPLGDFSFGEIADCRFTARCSIWEGNSNEDGEAHNNWAQQIVRESGWPLRDDSVFIVDNHYPEDGTIAEFNRWWELPTPYGRQGSHGTIVASVAAGTNLGVAPGATIIPIANNLSDDQTTAAQASNELRLAIQYLPIAERRQFDESLAKIVRDNYRKFDIINRSYGHRLTWFSYNSALNNARWLSRYLPISQNADWQSDRPDAEKTIIVWAAGNDSDPQPGLGAYQPYLFPALRGHNLAVVATDPETGIIGDYSNRCGRLPSNWNSTRHGPHYCLAAPGTVRGLVPNRSRPGRGNVRNGLYGTSYATPVVSGALALLMEHFRGTRGNTQIVRRMLDTADRTGPYSDMTVYGAGFLDLEAALSPVGILSAGQTAQALSETTLQLPAAFGSITKRINHIELAAFDEQDFPFWVPLTTLISTREGNRSPIPVLKENGTRRVPTTDPTVFGLPWIPAGDAGHFWLDGGHGWITGLGPTSASLARPPQNGRWGYGMNFENASYLGSEVDGAFGSDLRSSMVWASSTLGHDFASGLRLDAMGTLALSLPRYEKDAIFRASPSILSTMSLRVGTPQTGVVIEQPLHAESGTGLFRIQNGRLENGQRLYDEYHVPLRPENREARMTLRHDREALGGEVAFQVSRAINSGHVSGQSHSSIGMTYRLIW